MKPDFIEEGFKDRTKYLYHYTSFNTLINYIFNENTLRFSPYKVVNDPLESKNWKFKLKYDSKLFKDFDFSDVEEAIKTVGISMIKYNKLLCFSRDYPNNFPISTNQPNDFINRNWSRGFGYPRMWSQYGNNHKGVCLVFDKQKLIKEINQKFIKTHQILHSEVIYGIYTSKNDSFPYNIHLTEKLLLDFNTEISNHLEKNRLGLFFTKSSDWINEVEYRWVINSPNEGFEYYRFNNSLEGIVFGSKVTNKEIKSVRTEIKKYKIEWDYLNPKLINKST